MRRGIQLNYPDLPLPAPPEETAFSAIEQILSTDEMLNSVTETFLAWRGNIEDTWDPTNSNCPFLRISPSGAESNWETEGQHRMPMEITIEAAVMGSDRRQIQRYWGAIRSALWPQNDPERRDFIRGLTQTAGISRPILTAPAYGVIEVGETKGGSRITLATGTLVLILLVSTP